MQDLAILTGGTVETGELGIDLPQVTLERVTSTPKRSQTMPLKRMRLYLPQAHSQSLPRPPRSGPSAARTPPHF